MPENVKAPTQKPTKEVLEALINEKGYRYAGEQYGVSDNTARRWAMAYGIDLKPKCQLQARERQGYQLIGEKFIYEKELQKKAGKVSTRKPRSTEPGNSEPKAPRTPKKIEEVKLKKEVVIYKEPEIKAPVPQAVRRPAVDMSKVKNRYSPAELAEFRRMVELKIQEGFEAICLLKESLSRVAENGTDDTASSGNLFEEGTMSMERENTTELLAKKQKHVNALNVALQRIGNGTYGICMVTGQLIPKERLLAVPHATKCVEAKTDSDNGKVVTPVEEVSEPDDEK